MKWNETANQKPNYLIEKILENTRRVLQEEKKTSSV